MKGHRFKALSIVSMSNYYRLSNIIDIVHDNSIIDFFDTDDDNVLTNDWIMSTFKIRATFY